MFFLRAAPDSRCSAEASRDTTPHKSASLCSSHAIECATFKELGQLNSSTIVIAERQSNSQLLRAGQRKLNGTMPKRTVSFRGGDRSSPALVLQDAPIPPAQQACSRPPALCAAIWCRMDRRASFATGEPSRLTCWIRHAGSHARHAVSGSREIRLCLRAARARQGGQTRWARA